MGAKLHADRKCRTHGSKHNQGADHQRQGMRQIEIPRATATVSPGKNYDVHASWP
jgi:hypothetical protein